MKTKNCRLCRQHGRLLDVNRHDCPFKECDCEKCELIRTQRGIMSRQIRMRRRAAGSRAERPAVRYSCQNCQNHGIQTAKKNHQKVCPFRDCRCADCVLAAARCDVEQKVRQRCLTKPKGGESPDRPSTPPSTTSESPAEAIEPVEPPAAFRTFRLVQNPPRPAVEQPADFLPFGLPIALLYVPVPFCPPPFS